MRILHVINHTGRLNGNVHAAVDLACVQARGGHSVRVCHGGGDFESEFAANGVESEILPLRRSPAAFARTALRLALTMRRWQADIVHAHMVTSALIAAAGCRLTRRPLVTTVHNVFDRSARLMGVGDRVIAVSAAVGAAMSERGIPAKRLRVVLNGTIGSARFPPGRVRAKVLPGPSVLFVGGLHPRKGIADLLEAFDRVHGAHPEARLYLVGEGPMEADYRETAAGLASAEAITFCGSEKDPRPYLLGADIFVLPSLADSAPLVLSEAREAGCAVIGTAVDGIPELLEHGKAGILVPAASPEKLARAIRLLVEDPEALAHWRARSQHDIARLTIDRVAQDTVAVYEDCLPAARRARAGLRDPRWFEAGAEGAVLRTAASERPYR